MLSRSVVSDSATPQTVTHQAPLSMEFSRQEYWSGLPLPTPDKVLALLLNGDIMQANSFSVLKSDPMTYMFEHHTFPLSSVKFVSLAVEQNL